MFAYHSDLKQMHYKLVSAFNLYGTQNSSNSIHTLQMYFNQSQSPLFSGRVLDYFLEKFGRVFWIVRRVSVTLLRWMLILALILVTQILSLILGSL